MWFGTRAVDQKTIFALPGNPISTLICFYNYFLPSILYKENTHGIAEITNIKPANAGLDLWLPAKWLIPFQQAEILPNNGSGDMVGWKDADIIIWQKAGDNSVYLPYVQLI
jgi:molybdopterin molybdotransferase